MLRRISVKRLILIVVLFTHLFLRRCTRNLFAFCYESSLKLLYLCRILNYLAFYFRNGLLLLLRNILLSRYWSLATFWRSRNLWSRLQLRWQSLKVILFRFLSKLADFTILLLNWCVHLRISLRILVIKLAAAHKRLWMLHSSSLRRLYRGDWSDRRSSIWTLIRALSSDVTLWMVSILRFSVPILLIQFHYSFNLLVAPLAFIK